jgi:ubiquinone biosynthesis protein UbiJ
MATQSPFSLLEGFLQKLPLPEMQPPAWAVDEAQRRLVLLLNHVLMQEPEAMSRLTRQKGRVMQVQWRTFKLRLLATPAGLLDLAEAQMDADLVMTLTEESPLALVQTALRGEKPAVRIEGDVQLAAEVNWLVEHVRWDLEEDLARLMGDVPAHAFGQMVRAIRSALGQFISSASAFKPAKSSS